MTESLLLFLGFSALGVSTMAPSVTFGDSGELAACAATLGLAHAPGYPLYALLGRALGAALGLGNWAYRTNLLSALASAAALAVLADGLRRAGFGRGARLCAVAALGLAPAWRYAAGVTEVFALHALLLSCLLWLACRYAGTLWSDRPAAALGLCCGLGLANHQTLALALPALLLEGLVSSPVPGRRSGRGAAVAAAFAALGFLAYALLPLRAARLPPLDWGHPVDLPRLLHVLLRKDYGSLSLTVEGAQSAGGWTAVWSQLRRFAAGTWTGLGAPGALLAAAGLFAWRRCGVKPSLALPLAWIALTGPFFFCLGNPPLDAQTSGALERFYLAPWLAAALLIAAAAELALRRLPAPRAWAAALAVLLCAPGAASFAAWSERGDFAGYDYGRSVLKSVPPRAALFMDGGDDTFYTTAFLSLAQGRRSDVELRDRGGLVFANAYGPDFRALPREQKEARRVRVEALYAQEGRLFYSTFKTSIIPGYALRAWGLLKRAVREGSPSEDAEPWALCPRRWDDERLTAHYRDRALVAAYPFLEAQALDSAGAERALDLAREADAMGPDVQWLRPNLAVLLSMLGYDASRRRDWALAERALVLARRLAPADVDACLNLGVAEERLGRSADAERLYKEGAALAPASPKPLFDLGALYWSQKRWGEAAAAFGAASARAPQDPALARWAAQARLRASR